MSLDPTVDPEPVQDVPDEPEHDDEHLDEPPDEVRSP